jgi:hypothetical protein
MDWNWLWDASEFVTRNHCGPGWTPELISLYMISNAIIALAYFAIPIALYFLYKKDWGDPPASRMIALFITFIFLCGLTHVGDVVVFYWAPYRLHTFLYMLTAIASAVPAFKLPFLVARLVKYPSPAFVNKLNDQLREEVLRRAEAEKEYARRNEILKARMSTLEDLLKANAIKTLEDLQRTNQWIHERNAAMEELRKLLSEWETS